MTREEGLLSGRLAREMAPDGFITWAVAEIRAEIADAWGRSKPGEVETREALHAELRVLDKLLRRLHGLTHERMIRDTEQEESRVSRP